MFDHDVLEPAVLVEREAILSRGKDVRRMAFLTPISALPIKAPVLLPPEASLGEAAELMIEEGAHSALVVCNGGILGLLDEADILRMVRTRYADLDRISVWRAMTPEPPTCLDSDHIATALRSFRLHAVRQLAVVREDGSPVGILDLSTMVTWIANQLIAADLD